MNFQIHLLYKVVLGGRTGREILRAQPPFESGQSENIPLPTCEGRTVDAEPFPPMGYDRRKRAQVCVFWNPRSSGGKPQKRGRFFMHCIWLQKKKGTRSMHTQQHWVCYQSFVAESRHLCLVLATLPGKGKGYESKVGMNERAW